MAKKMKRIRPRGNRVLLLPIGKETEVKGIVIPEAAQKRESEAKVVAAGPEVNDLAPGDIVLLPTFGGTKIAMHGEEYLLIPEAEIGAVIE